MHNDDREVLRQAAYGEPSKLEAHQRLWSFVDARRETGRISGVLDLAGDETVVDVGCGNGRDLVTLRSDGHQGPIVGVDFSLGMLASVPQGAAMLVTGDAVSLPLRDSCADVVCALHMLYHVPNIGTALEEAKRVMRPAGAFVCSTNSDGAVRELIEPWSAAMVAVGGPALTRQSHAAFSVESGEPLLRASFGSVELRPVEVVARVPAADVVRDYVASTEDLYRSQLPNPSRWNEVLDQVHDHAAAVIERDGTFDITQRGAIFVCRR